eukprot:SAG25_NODE_11742_length_296_cov_1.279188_1_plen_22_part_10
MAQNPLRYPVSVTYQPFPTFAD